MAPKKRPTDSATPSSKKRKPEPESEEEFDDFFESVSDDDANKSDNEEEGDDDNRETADEARLRLAQEYLKKIGDHDEDSDSDDAEKSDADDTHDAVAKHLAMKAKEAQGRLVKEVAEKIKSRLGQMTEPVVICNHGHGKTITCTALMPDEVSAFSGSKDGTIVHWDLETGKKLAKIRAGRAGKKYMNLPKSERPTASEEGHCGDIFSMDVSHDGRYLVTVGKDKLIRSWDTRTHQLIDTFKGHTNVIDSVAFRKGSYECYTGSRDRTIKVWNVADGAYVETLFGHQAEITCLDALSRQRCLSASADGTVRLWKILDETQLVYRGIGGAIDCCCLLNDDTYISGGQNGSLCAWSSTKKKPTSFVNNAHPHNGKPGWISSVGALTYSDIFASGSCDGALRLWKVAPGKHGPEISALSSVPMSGFINSVRYGREGKVMIAGAGKEHRFGRWDTVKEAKNAVYVVRLKDQGKDGKTMKVKANLIDAEADGSMSS